VERFLLQDAVRPGSHLAVSRRHKRSSVGVHWHNYIELELITGGTGWQKLNGQRYELRRGSLCLLRLTDFHEINPDPELHILNLSVDEEFLSRELLERLSQGKAMMFQMEEDQTRTMEQLLQLCMEENGQAQPDQAYLEHLISCVLLRLLKLVPEQRGYGSDGERPFQAALLYLHMHFRENPSLGELAKIAHYNVSHFSMVFHRELGMTYTQYLNMLKTDYAKELLVSTDLKITEVCQECGFTSHSNFLRLIKAATGMPPMAYRKQCRK